MEGPYLSLCPLPHGFELLSITTVSDYPQHRDVVAYRSGVA